MKSYGDKFNKVIFHSHFCPKILIQKRTKNVHITILFQNSANHIIRELTSSAELQNVAVLWRTSIKCKTKKRHVQGVQKLFLLIKYANVCSQHLKKMEVKTTVVYGFFRRMKAKARRTIWPEIPEQRPYRDHWISIQGPLKPNRVSSPYKIRFERDEKNGKHGGVSSPPLSKTNHDFF